MSNSSVKENNPGLLFFFSIDRIKWREQYLDAKSMFCLIPYSPRHHKNISDRGEGSDTSTGRQISLKQC